LGLKKDRAKARPLIQVEHGLEGEEEKMSSSKKMCGGKFENREARMSDSREMFRAAGNCLNYALQKDRCAARGGMLG